MKRRTWRCAPLAAGLICESQLGDEIKNWELLCSPQEDRSCNDQGTRRGTTSTLVLRLASVRIQKIGPGFAPPGCC